MCGLGWVHASVVGLGWIDENGPTSNCESNVCIMCMDVYVCVCVWLGISGRALRPTLGLVDPLNAASMPARVSANTGFDVLWFATACFLVIQ